VRFEARVTGATNGKVRWIEDGSVIDSYPGAAIDTAGTTAPLNWTSDGHRHWFRAEVTGPDGALWLIANPIYVNWTEANTCY